MFRRLSVALLSCGTLCVLAFAGVTAITSSTDRIPSPVETVNPTSLSPTYNGSPSSWKVIEAAKAAGQAKVVWLYSYGETNYAVAFDTLDEFTSWACQPSLPERAVVCPDVELNRQKGTTP